MCIIFMKNFYLLFVKNPLIFFIACLFKLNTAKIPAHVTIICVHTCVFVLHLWYSMKVFWENVYILFSYQPKIETNFLKKISLVKYLTVQLFVY